MWSGLWQKHARYRETNVAIAYEQQGFFEQAQGAYEVAMSKVHNDYSSSPAPGSVRSELRLWEEHWIRQVAAHYLNSLSGQGHLVILKWTVWKHLLTH